MRYIALKKFLAGWSVVIFFNIIPALFAIAVGYDRGFFVLESLPLVLLAGMGARFFAFAYGIIFAGLELIYGVSQAYPLFEATQLIDVVEFLPNANKKYILLVVVYFFVFFGIVFLGAKLAAGMAKTQQYQIFQQLFVFLSVEKLVVANLAIHVASYLMNAFNHPFFFNQVR